MTTLSSVARGAPSSAPGHPLRRLERPELPGQHFSLALPTVGGLTPREVRLWTPTRFQSDQPYEVLLAHDGQNLFDPGFSYGGVPWGLDKTLQRLIDQGRLRQVVVIGVPNSARRFEEYAPEDPLRGLSPDLWRQAYGARSGSPAAGDFPGLANRYLSLLFDHVLPESLAALGLQAPGQGVTLMGSSMGGLISLYGLCKRPVIVRQAACLSTHWPMTVNVELLRTSSPASDAVAQSYRDWLETHLPRAGRHRIYMDHGTLNLDSLYAPHQRRVDEILQRKGYTAGKDWSSRVFEGTDHNETAWAARLEIPMEFLFAPAARPI